MKKITAIPSYECMTCHHKMDSSCPASKAYPDATPEKDDISVCLHCGTLTKYDEQLNMIPLTEEELQKIKAEDPGVFSELMHAQGVVHAMNKQN